MTNTIADDELVKRFQSIRVTVVNGRRSPHKPILLLWAIGRQLNGENRMASFDAVEDELNSLIRRFGPPRSRANADLPFWHLRNDDELWEVVRPDLVRVTSAKHAYISDLRKLRIRGGLTQRVLDKLDANPELVRRIVQNLLNAFFPPSLHQDVLWETRLHHFTEISVQSMTKLRRSNRDRSFRLAVLNAYGTRCAVCGFAVRLSNYPVGLEAAHIRWHSADGPADIQNGLALCVLHHRLFDEGLFTVQNDLSVLVGVAAGHGVEESLNRYDGSTLRVVPDLADQRPAAKYLEWHRQVVFRS